MSILPKRFATKESLDASLAERIAQALATGIESRGTASLVVSGGRTPAGLFTQLRNADLDWSKVVITLADERWVPETHPDSNARSVREHLLTGRAAHARFVPLYNSAQSPWAGLAACDLALDDLPRPFDAVLLGMGEDGHTASLFPADAVAPPPSDAQGRHCLALRPLHAPHDRISLTPATLRDARTLSLHITGARKWSVLWAALHAGPCAEYPVRHVLHQDEVDCSVFWAA